MRILALTPTKDDTTSFYRAAGVFRNLENKMPGLRIDCHDFGKLAQMTWSLFSQYDIVFLQRPWNQIGISKYLKEMRIPVWIDYDDNLFEIPQANSRAFDAYMTDPGIKNNLIELGKIADVVTVSTKALKSVYDYLNKDVRVINNALPFNLIGKPQEGKTSQSIMWRGGDSHRMDLRVYEAQILANMNKYQEWDFVFAGYNPWQFVSKNKKYIKPQDPIIYFNWMKNFAPRGMQIPLANDFFNQCKSNIAALEGTFSGAVCLVPDWEEWQIPGTLKYKNAEEYGERLNHLLKGEFSYSKFRSMAMEYIMDEYNLDNTNNLRVQVINDLMNLKR